MDLVAVAHVADCMDTNTLENRYINKVGLSNIFNEGLRALIKQQAYSLFRMKSEDITEDFLDSCRLTQTQVAYYIAPLVNALIRVGNQNEKDLLFKAFTEVYALEEISSTKRGHSNETETIAEQNARNCANARARQNKEKEKAGELLDIQIIENCLDENQILVLHADDLNVSTTLTGLCATEIVSRYKKPVLLGRTNSEGLFRGSVRGVSNCELTDTKQFLLDSNLMDYAEGHSQAFGFSIKEKNIPKLLQYANTKLSEINFNEGVYEVDFIVAGNYSKLNDLIFDLTKNDGESFGQFNPEPKILVKDITLNKKDIRIVGAAKNVINFTFNNIKYVMFKAEKIIDEINGLDNKINLTVIGTPNRNEYMGNVSPQIMISDIEIKEDNYLSF